jgi:hypothetical protein
MPRRPRNIENKPAKPARMFGSVPSDEGVPCAVPLPVLPAAWLPVALSLTYSARADLLPRAVALRRVASALRACAGWCCAQEGPVSASEWVPLPVVALASGVGSGALCEAYSGTGAGPGGDGGAGRAWALACVGDAAVADSAARAAWDRAIEEAGEPGLLDACRAELASVGERVALARARHASGEADEAAVLAVAREASSDRARILALAARVMPDVRPVPPEDEDAREAIRRVYGVG